jgi:hypothetical protein
VQDVLGRTTLQGGALSRAAWFRPDSSQPRSALQQEALEADAPGKVPPAFEEKQRSGRRRALPFGGQRAFRGRATNDRQCPALTQNPIHETQSEP